MSRYVTVAALILVLAPAVYSQDSGPGPDPARSDSQRQYDVVLYQRNSTLKGAMIFSAATDSSSALTSGDLNADLNDEQFTGSWRAYDLGTFAFWYGHANGSTNNLTALGWATPDFVVGWVNMSEAGSGGWFFQLFARKTYFLHGTVAATPVAN